MNLLNLSIIPCKDKKPLVAWKTYQDDPPSGLEVEIWKERYPDCQWALICGRVSGGIVVLDVDDVLIAEEILKTQKGVTRMHRTPSGGLHLIFREMDGISPSKPLVPGKFDLKSNGGYIVIPPSQGYEVVDDTEVQEVSNGEEHITGWLKTMGYWVEPKLSVGPAKDDLFRQGSRNVALTKVAGSLRRYGSGYEVILKTLLELNQRQCQPPLEESEVSVIAKSCSRYVPETVVPSEHPGLEKLLRDRLNAPRVPYHLKWLSEWNGSARGGEIIVLAGRPGEGKTSYAVSWAHALAEKNIRTAFFSLEETREEILSRLAVMAFSLHPKRLELVYMTEDDWAKVMAFDEVCKNWSLSVHDGIGYQASEIESWLNTNSVDVIFLDHVQLMRRRSNMSERESLDEELKALRALALSRKVVVVILSQMNRQQYQRDTEEPNMGDLHGTSMIERIASLLLLLWWPKRSEGGKHIMKVEKNRRGPKHGGLRMHFEKINRSFTDESFEEISA